MRSTIWLNQKVNSIEKIFSLKNRFSGAPPPNKGLTALLMVIFGLSMVDNLEPSRFHLKSDLTVGKVPSLDRTATSR